MIDNDTIDPLLELFKAEKLQSSSFNKILKLIGISIKYAFVILKRRDSLYPYKLSS